MLSLPTSLQRSNNTFDAEHFEQCALAAVELGLVLELQIDFQNSRPSLSFEKQTSLVLSSCIMGFLSPSLEVTLHQNGLYIKSSPFQPS